MVERLGQGTTLKVLDRRELENYMLDAEAVRRFLSEKREAAGLSAEPTPIQELTARIQEEARSLKDEVIRLRYEGSALKPVFLQRRDQKGTPEERLARAVEDLSCRLEGLPGTREQIAAEVEVSWERDSLDRAPGGLILDRVARRYDVRFSKEGGDSARLARLLSKEAIPEELRELLRDITDESPR